MMRRKDVALFYTAGSQFQLFSAHLLFAYFPTEIRHTLAQEGIKYKSFFAVGLTHSLFCSYQEHTHMQTSVYTQPEKTSMHESSRWQQNRHKQPSSSS